MGRSRSPLSLNAYATAVGGPGLTVRTTSPASANPARRSDRTASLMPGTARRRAPNVDAPLPMDETIMPFHRLPSTENARVTAASQT